jgi:hypothetical protein
MSLQINLKLKLSKTKKRITVKYNTFEKATYDEFLISSVALRSKNSVEALKYIDDITGAGSLNSHFKHLYQKISAFSEDQLNKIMQNSMFPILKIDDSNWYYYYPQLDVSEYRSHVYKGDLAKYDNLAEEILYISEDIIDLQVSEERSIDNPEPYEVELDRNQVKVKIQKNLIEISSDLFASLISNELNSINQYQGTMHTEAQGDRWSILNDSTIENLFKNENYYYDGGDHYQIKTDCVRKTTVALINGLYIYRETIIQYVNNRSLCEKVIDVMLEKRILSEMRVESLLKLIQNIDEVKAQRVVNNILERVNSKEMSMFGLKLLGHGLYREWSKTALQKLLAFAYGRQIEDVYKADSELDYSIDQLLSLDKSILSIKHVKEVEKYNQDLQKIKDAITNITGEVTVSGLREKIKTLEANDDTRKFSKLCNDLIGHVKKNLGNASWSEAQKWLEQAKALKELMIKLSVRIDA